VLHAIVIAACFASLFGWLGLVWWIQRPRDAGEDRDAAAANRDTADMRLAA
jgi:hypothetical protein